MRLPTTLGGLVDRRYALQQERLALSRKVDETKRLENEVDAEIKRLLLAQKSEGAKGRTAQVSLGERSFIYVQSWESFHAYVLEHESFDMLERRPAKKAIEDRLAEGIEMPFLTRESEIVVHVSKLAEKKATRTKKRGKR